MNFTLSQEEISMLAKALAQELAKELLPLLQARVKGQEDKVFGVRELAQYLGQKPSWVYAHISEIPHTKKGGFLMFKKSAIDKWLEPDYYPISPGSLVLDRRGRL